MSTKDWVTKAFITQKDNTTDDSNNNNAYT